MEPAAAGLLPARDEGERRPLLLLLPLLGESIAAAAVVEGARWSMKDCSRLLACKSLSMVEC